MEGIGNFISMMDYILDTHRKDILQGHSVECLFTFWWFSIDRYDYQDRGG